MIKLKTLEYYEKHPTSKGDICKNLLKDFTFDYALPENWVQDMKSKLKVEYHYITCQFVWGYPKGNFFGCPVPLTEDAQRLIQMYNQAANTNYQSCINCILGKDH